MTPFLKTAQPLGRPPEGRRTISPEVFLATYRSVIVPKLTKIPEELERLPPKNQPVCLLNVIRKVIPRADFDPIALKQ